MHVCFRVVLLGSPLRRRGFWSDAESAGHGSRSTISARALTESSTTAYQLHNFKAHICVLLRRARPHYSFNSLVVHNHGRRPSRMWASANISRSPVQNVGRMQSTCSHARHARLGRQRKIHCPAVQFCRSLHLHGSNAPHQKQDNHDYQAQSKTGARVIAPIAAVSPIR